MMGRPLNFTLFPYTTLFRSHGDPALDDAVGGHAGERGAVPADPAGARDRKSTRLNSSHSSISYAVFCLKKKNTTVLVMWPTENNVLASCAWFMINRK